MMMLSARTVLSPQFNYFHLHPIPRNFHPSVCCKNPAFSSTKFRFLSNPADYVTSPSVPHVQPLSGCLSQREDGLEPTSERLSPVAGGIVALGKFDALHIGHRELAIQASKIGFPFLLSFTGMAEVLGWEPRAPIVAKRDRKRVLGSWAPYCSNLTPKEFQIDFSKVRSLTPRQFVEKLSGELGVYGVVAGENYRFGYRASGDASELVRLCQEYGMKAHIINSVMDNSQPPGSFNSSDSKDIGQVSSTRLCLALSKGDMKYVSGLLGRYHRLMLDINQQEATVIDTRISAPRSCLLNLHPVESLYENCTLRRSVNHGNLGPRLISTLLIGDQDVLPCRVIIDRTHIHLELDDMQTCSSLASQDSQLLSIDFGE